MVRKILVILIVSFFVFSGFSFADYLFNVERQETHLWINHDGSVDIWYYIHFKNLQRGDTIDIVDIGLPFNNYNLKSAKASIDGEPLYIVRKSEYIKTGVEIPLGNHSIPPGGKGVLMLKINQPDMLFQDDIDENYASIEFITNFYGDKFVFGTTLLEVYIHFPVGVTAKEPRYHKTEFTYSGFDDQKRLYYYWQLKAADISLGYRFGASFPKKYVDEGVVKKVTIFTKIGMFFANIFRNIFPEPLLFTCIIPYGIIGFFVLVGIFGGRKRRMQYLKPQISARGVGIKRGLTAVEAAILLERKFNKIFAMIVFGLLKKGYITIKNKQPLTLEKVKIDKPDYHEYETNFLDAINENGLVDKGKLKKCAVDLVKQVETKMKGFNFKMTRNYYESIVDTAWKHVQSADLENSVDWAMLDDKFNDKFERSLPTETSYTGPTWWPYYYRGYYGHDYVPVPVGSGGGGAADIGKATLSPKQFVNSVADGFESFSHNVVSSVESFTSGVTDVTNPVPKSSSSWSSGSGGGSSCACACACAGCACACAGGGR
jgi:hypothetical protein